MRPVSISPRNSVEVKEAMFKANTLLLPLDIQKDFPLGSAIGFRPDPYQLNSAIQVSLSVFSPGFCLGESQGPLFWEIGAL